MSSPFQAFRGVTLPVVEWNFFESPEDAETCFNSSTWEGWDPEWQTIATNGRGDAIVIHDGKIHEIQHGTGESPKLDLVADDLNSLVAFFTELRDFAECSEDDSVPALRQKRAQLEALKKIAPKALKADVAEAISDAKELIADVRWKQSPAGKLQAYVEGNHEKWEAGVQDKWQVTDLMIRRHISNKAIAVIGMADEEDIPMIIEHLSQILDYPVKDLLKAHGESETGN